MNDIFNTSVPVPSETFVTRILRERYGIFAPKFTRNAYGKPSLCSTPPHFSLSHTGGRTFAAFSQADVGLDAEWRKRPLPQAVLRRLSEAEREEDFFRLWTAKEAYVKYLGGSLAVLLPALRFERGALLHNNAPVNAALAFFEQAGCTVAVCTAQAQPVLFHEILPQD